MAKTDTAPVTIDDLEYAPAFLNTIATSPRTAQAYRYGLLKLAEFIAASKYLEAAPDDQKPPAPKFRASHLRDDLLLKFHEWLGRQRYAEPTRDNYLAAVKRYLIWLDANDHLPAGFQVGKAVNRLKAARGGRRAAKAGREPDPGIPRIVTYYDSIPLPSLDEKNGRRKRLEILRARAIVHTLYASAGRVSEVAALTREMAVEFAQLGVRVNAVAPGEIETDMIGPDYEPLINRIPMHRMGTPDEVAATVFQLCQPDFGYVTGTEIFVTGGQHLY